MLDRPVTAGNPFHRILGQWRIQRSVTGTAVICGAAEVLLVSESEAIYQERVSVALASGERLMGSRSYLHRCTENGFDILFADTLRLFHSLRFLPLGDVLVADGSHACGLDLYSSRYILGRDDDFSVCHSVRGPRKRYAINTVFSR